MKKILINHFSLSLSGLTINYSTENSTNNLSLDPSATCDLLNQVGAIEGFDLDRNGEPIILYTAIQGRRITTGYSFWVNFCITYPMTDALAQRLVNVLRGAKQHKPKPLAKVIPMFRSLQAA